MCNFITIKITITNREKHRTRYHITIAINTIHTIKNKGNKNEHARNTNDIGSGCTDPSLASICLAERQD